MKVINLFGAAGSGKSTLAAYFFSLMKKRGEKTGLVTEYAKDLVYDNDTRRLNNQLLILATQYDRILRLQNVYDYVITDSPLLLSIVYAKEPYENFHEMAWCYFNQFNNVNFFLGTKWLHQNYTPEGRIHSIVDGCNITVHLLGLLHNQPLYHLPIHYTDEEVLEYIYATSTTNKN